MVPDELPDGQGGGGSPENQPHPRHPLGSSPRRVWRSSGTRPRQVPQRRPPRVRSSPGSSGYAAAGLGEISERAGMTKGALYHHSGSKEALATPIIEQGTNLTSDVFRHVCQSSSPHSRT